MADDIDFTVQTPFLSAPGVPAVFGADVSTYPDLDGTFTLRADRHMIGEAVMRRFMTPRGALVNASNYGIDLRAYLNASYNPQTPSQIESDADAQAEVDERVQAATTTVTVNQQRMRLEVKTELQTISGPTALQFVLNNVSAAGGSNVGPAPTTPSLPMVLALPGPVEDLVATPGDTLVDLSWSPPTDYIETGVTGYRIHVEGDMTLDFETTDLSFEVTGLTNGVDYTFTVTPIGISGDGPGTDVDATPVSPVAPMFWVRVRGSAATPWASPGDAITNNDWRGVSFLSFNGTFEDIWLALGTTLAGVGAGALCIALQNQRGDIWHTPAGAVPAGIWVDACTNYNPDTGLGGSVAVMVGTTLAGVGCIARSTDGGEHWTLVTTPAGTSGYNGITFVGGSINKFLIVGNNGKSALSSSNLGTAFTAHNMSTAKNYNDVLYSLSYGAAFAVAQGNGEQLGTIDKTFDGVSWSGFFGPTISPATTNWQQIADNNGGSLINVVGTGSGGVGQSMSGASEGEGFGAFNDISVDGNNYSRVTYNSFHVLFIYAGESFMDATASNPAGAGAWTEFSDVFGLQFVASSFAWSIGIGGFDPDSGDPVVGIYGFEV